MSEIKNESRLNNDYISYSYYLQLKNKYLELKKKYDKERSEKKELSLLLSNMTNNISKYESSKNEINDLIQKIQKNYNDLLQENEKLKKNIGIFTQPLQINNNYFSIIEENKMNKQNLEINNISFKIDKMKVERKYSKNTFFQAYTSSFLDNSECSIIKNNQDESNNNTVLQVYDEPVPTFIKFISKHNI